MDPQRGSGPGIMLGVMLVLACCIAAGGVMVARKETEERRDRDHTAMRAVTTAMQREARALEDLYERHLKDAGALLTQAWRDGDEPRRIAQNLEGIQRVSWLFWKSANEESHLNIGFPVEPPLPEPTLLKEHSGLPRARVLLDSKTIFHDAGGESSGWIDEPGKPLMFYVQVLGTAVVLTIDRDAVQFAMTGHFKSWLDREFRPLEQLGGPDAVQDSHGKSLRAAGVLPKRQPDLLGPVVSRFGGWQLASWDERVTTTSYHLPTLAGAFALALLVAFGGVTMSAQQRRAAKLAAQRVSFVNRVSHELRTPMTNILLNLDVIEERLPEGSASRFGLVREEAGRLSRLIENVLTFSKREEGRLKLENEVCKPAEVVSRVLSQFEPALARRGITFENVHEGPKTAATLAADALAQITANLLSNVEKYAPNTHVAIRTCQTDRTFALTVSDSGPGITPGDAERIFEPFVRLDDRVQAGVSGAGLGLSIARDLARRMGGELKIVPKDKGACFVFELPLEQRNDTP